ncbi:MAG TPA: glycosyltransferase WbuB, partial [Candidatus Ratteibacteria bacterium]|nr:glycosyltransferase WbuB [Candidatus Ratteibacteria bacterium]
LFDVCYIGWRDKNLYRYGVSANKLFDYMYSGKPILHSFNGKGDIVQITNCGITVKAENPEAIADGIMKLYNMSKEERKKLGENGKNYVVKYFNYEFLAGKLSRVL